MQRSFIRRHTSHRRPLVVGALALVGALACGGAPGSSGPATDASRPALPAARLTLVAYSTPQGAYEKIIAAFQKTAQGRNVTFSESYGASGDQSRAVDSGLPADVVAFSLEPDMTRLVKHGLVAAEWSADQYRGNVTDSVVVLAVRKGNPRHIKGWDDLLERSIEVITPNPFTSGGARWNVLAAYAARSGGGKDDRAGLAYLNELFQHVPVQDTSARNSLQTFANGKGDVLIAYQNEAIFAQQRGQALDYVIPEQSILIENPVAVTTRTRHPEQARAFLDFLHTRAAQRIFADAGYRPVVSGVAGSGEFVNPATLYTIDDVGGWTSVDKKLFDPQTGALVDVERKLGVATR
ncbi:MAG TPA: sulfate ABC transporter substrate-binding protein [Candidatus Eisenbacteria bacterium]|nr:sulfate ABC transporter substrate-binding protein [Candidatus Eisenbacteria bacterium]